jgi:hypothetical protein
LQLRGGDDRTNSKSSKNPGGLIFVCIEDEKGSNFTGSLIIPINPNASYSFRAATTSLFHTLQELPQKETVSRRSIKSHFRTHIKYRWRRSQLKNLYGTRTCVNNGWELKV